MVYDLFGVVNHMGGMTGGHYTACCRSSPCSKDGVEEVTGWGLEHPWLNFDDEFVEVSTAIVHYFTATTRRFAQWLCTFHEVGNVVLIHHRRCRAALLCCCACGECYLRDLPSRKYPRTRATAFVRSDVPPLSLCALSANFLFPRMSHARVLFLDTIAFTAAGYIHVQWHFKTCLQRCCLFAFSLGFCSLAGDGARQDRVGSGLRALLSKATPHAQQRDQYDHLISGRHVL